MAGDDEGHRMIEPCTCSLCSTPAAPSATMAAPPEWSNLLSITDQEIYAQRRTEFYRSMSRHEAGHAICALAHGRGVLWITIGDGRPACGYGPEQPGETTIDAVSMTTCAGVVAGGQEWPTWSELHRAMCRARAGINGHCDTCQNARLYAATVADHDDTEIVEKWFSTFEAVADLFRTPEWSGALNALASELESRTLLTGDDITRITSTFDLAGPLETIKPIWTKRHED
jgi:hypothetical protein